MPDINFNSDDEQTGARARRRTWRQFVFRSGQYKDKSMRDVLETGAGRAYLRFLLSNSKGTFPHVDQCIVDALAWYKDEKQRAIQSGAYKPPVQDSEPATQGESSVTVPSTSTSDATSTTPGFSAPATDIEDCVVDYSPTPPRVDDSTDNDEQFTDKKLPSFRWIKSDPSTTQSEPSTTKTEPASVPKRLRKAT